MTDIKDVFNVLIVGYGSMGRRHAKNLTELLPNLLNLDILRHTSDNADAKSKDSEYNFLYLEADLKNSYDAIFITNPTSLHYETLKRLQKYSDAFFIEKPVFMTGEEDSSIFCGPSMKYYVACPLRYTNVIQYMKDNIDFSDIYSLRAISSSYLPDWRPGTDYRRTYSSHKDMGGGVSIDLIHEWDYITYLIGFPDVVKSVISRKSNLEIDSDDVAIYIAEYTDKVVELHLDYFGKKTTRRLELYGKDDTIVADLAEQRITWLSTGKSIELFEKRDAYQKKELKHFMNIISGSVENDNGIEKACRVLRIARGVG